MTTKDYKLIAELLQEALEETALGSLAAEVIIKLSVKVEMALAARNPRFDSNRFYEAIKRREEPTKCS